ncbi:odontogenic ameloblast-associated protein isoform X2 [Ascaphus truei]|uniref:odontogenic ameloblast-associated protein isoform X2 n=1 Tax=Ascaphus truei TaxID=8439 RepID=UPI003F5A26C1
MKAFAILVQLVGAVCAVPLVPQRIVSASNSNELLVGLINPNLPQGSAMNILLPGILQQQQQLLQPKIIGLSQVPFGAHTGLTAPIPNQVPVHGQIQPMLPPNLAVQSVLLDPILQMPHQSHQRPNQMTPYMISYGIPQKQGQAFGCFVPQFNGEVLNFERVPAGSLQLPTNTPNDPLALNENPTFEPNTQEDKVYPTNIKEP